MRLNLNLGGMWKPKAVRERTVKRADRQISVADMKTQVRLAQREWEAARNYFQFVSEPVLVDHAIYALQAAERKYMYLLGQLKERLKNGEEGTRWMQRH